MEKLATTKRTEQYQLGILKKYICIERWSIQ